MTKDHSNCHCNWVSNNNILALLDNINDLLKSVHYMTYKKYWKLFPTEIFLFLDFSGAVHEQITHNCAGEWPYEQQSCLQHNIKHCSRLQFLYVAEIQSPIKYSSMMKDDTNGRFLLQYPEIRKISVYGRIKALASLVKLLQ